MERSTQKVYELGAVNEQELCSWAKVLGEYLRGGELLLLEGELGSGKTKFVRCVAQSLGIDETVIRSPSFTIVNVYPGSVLTLIHADLFRLSSAEEAWDTGLMEMLDSKSVVAVEWPELIMKDLRETKTIIVELSLVDSSHRFVSVFVDSELDYLRESLDKYFERFSGGL